MTGFRGLQSNEYRNVPTEAILGEAECWCWDLSELRDAIESDPEANPLGEAGVAFVLYRLGQINDELARRDRLRPRPEAPGWPASWPDRRLELDRIKQAIDLPTFVEQMFQVRLEKGGKQLACRCPLPGHDDKTPSFYVHPEKQLWHCHGCHRGGDIFTLAMHYHGTDRFADVVGDLSREADLALGARREARVG